MIRMGYLADAEPLVPNDVDRLEGWINSSGDTGEAAAAPQREATSPKHPPDAEIMVDRSASGAAASSSRPDRDPERMAQRFVKAKQGTFKPRTRSAHKDNYATVVGYINLFGLAEGEGVFTEESHLDMATAALFWERMIAEQQKAILEGRTGEADARKNKAGRARWASYPMRIMVRMGATWGPACMQW